MSESKMVPSVHLNGTSVDALFEQIANATSALRAAILKLDEAQPNARDYYPQGDSAYGRAVREHSDRIMRVHSVLAEMEALAEHVADARDARATRIGR